MKSYPNWKKEIDKLNEDEQEEGLFTIKQLRNKEHVETVGDVDASQEYTNSEDDSDEDEAPNRVKYSKEKGVIHEDKLYYKHSDDEFSDEEEEMNNDSDNDALDLKESKSGPAIELRDGFKKSEMWFDKDAFKGLQDDIEDLEEIDIQNAITDIKNRNGSIKEKGSTIPVMENKVEKKKSTYNSDNSEIDENNDDSDGSSSDSDSDYEDVRNNMKNGFHAGSSEADGFEVVPIQKKKKTGSIDS
ncbi:SPB1 [Lepeophtheirus salmonis]|uniref:SPB1 n=1 Tax=Lepeophtheirus salmonis TaxID=72036 RepID=A0A7R8H7Q7_LEPSM|nr:SPB1 [Lepeophtheirus salmonis]CAF2906341.1 SPB1 [Lepeophtheirus salmonis]